MRGRAGGERRWSQWIPAPTALVTAVGFKHGELRPSPAALQFDLVSVGALHLLAATRLRYPPEYVPGKLAGCAVHGTRAVRQLPSSIVYVFGQPTSPWSSIARLGPGTCGPYALLIDDNARGEKESCYATKAQL